ncbi:MAG: CoA transferase [Negativicutes bacterium]|nr:CoA transferase [Negativicutes bacterium]
MKNGKAALQGIRVLDLTQFLAGPFCTMILGDLGADIIKIEKPGTGDPARETAININGQSVYFMGLNNSKRSMIMDLKNPRYQQLFLKLAAKADIVVENFAPGTMEKLGLTYEDVKKVNPKIIYTSVSGFGQTGPYHERGALDMIIQAMSGFMSVTGEKGGRPLKAGPSIADIISGLYAAIGTLAALHHRDATGEGQQVDVAMLDSMFSILANPVGNYLATGKVPKPAGNRHQISAPFQPFETTDGEIIIAASTNRAFLDVCEALGRNDLGQDPRYANRKGRIDNVDELADEITKTTKTKTTAELARDCENANVPFATVNTIDKIVQDPQIAARQMLLNMEHPVAGNVKVIGSPLKMSETPALKRRVAPTLGQHTQEVLGEWLGMSEADVKALDE